MSHMRYIRARHEYAMIGYCSSRGVMAASKNDAVRSRYAHRDREEVDAASLRHQENITTASYAVNIVMCYLS